MKLLGKASLKSSQLPDHAEFLASSLEKKRAAFVQGSPGKPRGPPLGRGAGSSPPEFSRGAGELPLHSGSGALRAALDHRLPAPGCAPRPGGPALGRSLGAQHPSPPLSKLASPGAPACQPGWWPRSPSSGKEGVQGPSDTFADAARSRRSFLTPGSKGGGEGASQLWCSDWKAERVQCAMDGGDGESGGSWRGRGRPRFQK